MAVLVGLAVLTLAVLTFGALHIATRGTEAVQPAAVPQVGDCVTGGGHSGDRSVEVVDCDARSARYYVVRTFDVAGRQDRCAEVPGAEFTIDRKQAGGGVGLLCVTDLDVQGRGQNE